MLKAVGCDLVKEGLNYGADLLIEDMMKSQTSSIRKSVESKISIFFKRIEVKQALRWMIIVDNYDAGCQNMVSVMQDAENFCKAEESKLWSIGKSALNFGLSNLG